MPGYLECRLYAPRDSLPQEDLNTGFPFLSHLSNLFQPLCSQLTARPTSLLNFLFKEC